MGEDSQIVVVTMAKKKSNGRKRVHSISLLDMGFGLEISRELGVLDTILKLINWGSAGGLSGNVAVSDPAMFLDDLTADVRDRLNLSTMIRVGLKSMAYGAAKGFIPQHVKRNLGVTFSGWRLKLI